MGRRQSTVVNVRDGDRHLVLDAALDARFEAERGLVAALRVALPTAAVQDLYELPAMITATHDFSRCANRDQALAIAVGNAWASRWNLKAMVIRQWANLQIEYWLKTAHPWHKGWACGECVCDPVQHFTNAEPPWRHLPFLDASARSYTLDQITDLASLYNSEAQLEQLPVNGIGEDDEDCASPTSAPISASPLAESLNDFLERARLHYFERENRLIALSSKPLQRSAIGRREIETHCCWLIMSRVCGLSHQKIADASHRTRAAVSSAIASLEELLHFSPLTRRGGRPRKQAS